MRHGVSLQTKKEEKEAVTEEEEEKFWTAGLFGSGIAKQLLDTIYFYNNKSVFSLGIKTHARDEFSHFLLAIKLMNY